MNACLPLRLALFTALCAFTLSVAAQTLEGWPGRMGGRSWQASWLDLADIRSFRRGETLVIRLGGDAAYVVVRLLALDSDPNSPDGIDGGVKRVPANRALVVRLARDHPEVEQISVHSGAAVWDTELGQQNGRAMIVSIDRVAR